MNFDWSLNGIGERIFDKFILADEGGYCNNPSDKGGETCWGITIATARENGYMGDMRSMNRAEAMTIYLNKYWSQPLFNRIALGGMPKLAYVLADYGVNSGTEKAAMALQDALNFFNKQGTRWPDLDIDGKLGIKSLDALDHARAIGTDIEDLIILHIIAKRLSMMDNFADKDQRQEDFAVGWARRCKSVLLKGFGLL